MVSQFGSLGYTIMGKTANLTVVQKTIIDTLHKEDESKFCISIGNQGPRVWRKGGEAHSPSCLKSSVKFPQSVMIWGAMSSAAGFAMPRQIEAVIKAKGAPTK
ncbi:Protein SLE2 [Labeo rohita]|uniref:Protein SLE2 n=1 Tax=Labeo rohita TaxID=84645 RepID=A0ABQ8LQE5_LABRO|nr:Protein SLE2 [Labeo rohita]